MKNKSRVNAIYSRKSKFTGKGESIENQIELCRQYLQVQVGAEAAAAAVVYEDEGFSGGTLERPQFKKMMASARKGEISAIIVYRLDRISRNIGDFAKLIEELNELEISFVSIKERFETDNPMGRAMMYIASVFSQLERETIAERIRDNMHELAKTGRWLGGITPTGFTSEKIERVTLDGKTRKACKLKLIPEESEMILTIFRKFEEVNSLTKTDEFLLEHGFRTKNNKPFTRFAIRGILTNPVYMIADHDAYVYLTENGVDLFSREEEFDGEHGMMIYNRTIQKPGKSNQTRPMPEWIASVGKHPGLIPGANWVHIQKMLNLNSNKAYRKPRSNVALLSGILFCGSCGGYMRPKLTNRANAQGETIYTYLCEYKERSRGQCCKIKNVNGNILDATIIAEMKKLSEADSVVRRNVEKSRKAIVGERAEYEKHLEDLKTELMEKEGEIKALVTSLAKAAGTTAEAYIMEQIDLLHNNCQTLKGQIEELKALTARHELSDIEFDLFQAVLASISEKIDGLGVEQKRTLLRTIIKKVIWDGDLMHVYMFGCDGDYELPMGPDAPNQGDLVPLGEDSE